MVEAAPSPEFPFLTARWSNLAVLTYALDPQVLAPLLPPDCQLDVIDASAFVSLVAFDFLDTRVLKIGWPGHRHFPEINLRFYVRHNGLRGVCFVREFVPRRLIAWTARLLYNEPYQFAKMSSAVTRDPTTLTVEHHLTCNGSTNILRVEAANKPATAGHDSRDHFFKEHEWGFGRSRGGRLLRYRVHHPIWQTYPVTSHQLDWDWERVYGRRWALLQGWQPISTLLAEGSEVQVFPKHA